MTSNCDVDGTIIPWRDTLTPTPSPHLSLDDCRRMWFNLMNVLLSHIVVLWWVVQSIPPVGTRQERTVNRDVTIHVTKVPYNEQYFVLEDNCVSKPHSTRNTILTAVNHVKQRL